MMTVLIVIHVIVCLGLIGIVLIQRGRGSGLVESLSGVESVFGTKTSAFLTRTTTVLSILFFITCLSLAILSIRQSRSLMRNVTPQVTTTEGTPPAATAPAPEATAEPQKETTAVGAQAPFTQPEPQIPETQPPQTDNKTE